MQDLLADAPLADTLKFLGLLAGMGFVLMTAVVAIAGRIVALKERPDRRALITTAIGYFLVSAAFVFGGGSFIPGWIAPLIPLPGAVAIFLWLRFTYRKGWVDDDEVHEGMRLENSDWRIGLLVIGLALLLGAIKVYLRK